MNDWRAFKNQPIKIKHMQIGVLYIYIYIYQAIDVYISYLCCEYQLIWTLNEWFICGLVLANQIQAHVHTRAGMHFSVYQSIDGHIIYLCCEYTLIWSYNKWLIGFLVLANQIQPHAQVRADGQLRPHRLIVSISSYDINIKQIQWRTMKL
jgi:hypothetical protein